MRGRNGNEHTHKRVEGRNLMSLFGPVRVARVSYRAQGGEPLRPLDAELNLPRDLYSLPVRQRVVEEAAKASFERVGGHPRENEWRQRAKAAG